MITWGLYFFSEHKSPALIFTSFHTNGVLVLFYLMVLQHFFTLWCYVHIIDSDKSYSVHLLYKPEGVTGQIF